MRSILRYTKMEEAGTGEGAGGTGGGESLLAGKYETQDALIQGYTELNTAYSAKDEAHKAELLKFAPPEKYEAGKDWASDNGMHNRMMAVMQEVGKEHNLSQEGYEAMFNGITEMQGRVDADNLGEVQKSIANFDNRAEAMINTALRFLRPDQASALDSLMQSKESFEAVELLMAQVRGGTLPAMTGGTTKTQDELRAEIRNLNPADSSSRERLMAQLNNAGDGEGKLV